jgi:hypothetical protein
MAGGIRARPRPAPTLPAPEAVPVEDVLYEPDLEPDLEPESGPAPRPATPVLDLEDVEDLMVVDADIEPDGIEPGDIEPGDIDPGGDRPPSR